MLQQKAPPMAEQKPDADITFLKGAHKAAILMLVIGEERAADIFKQLQQEDVVEISKAMSALGQISADVVEAVCQEFSHKIKLGDGFVGSYNTTEEYLKRALSPDQAEIIMDNIRGPSGRNVWSKMGNMPEAALANYLRHEQPQTVAVILSYITPAHVARVLALFDDDFATDVITRILHMGPVSKSVLESLEVTLRSELISTFGRSAKRDSYAFVAEVYNHLDRKREASLTAKLGEMNNEDMEKVNKLKFTFDDIARLNKDDMMRVVAAINRNGELKPRLLLALKAAHHNVKDIFFGCMSRRAAGIMAEELKSLGPVRLRDAETAQMEIITLIKEMGKDGEINISPSSAEDEMIE